MQIELDEIESIMLNNLGFIRGEIEDLRKDFTKANRILLAERIKDFERLAIEFASLLTKEITY